MTNTTLFRNGRIFDGTGGEHLEGVEVLVDGERTAEVSDVPIRCEAAEVVDLRDRTLMPGLIDAPCRNGIIPDSCTGVFNSD